MSSQALPKTVEMLTEDVTQRDATIKALRLTIEKLKIELTHLKRMRYGRSSEKMDAAQTQLELLSAALAPLMPLGTPLDAVGDAKGSNVADLQGERKKRRNKSANPQQSGLPEHLPREDVVHSACAADCKCGACGTGLQQIGQDVSEVLDYAPGSFKVIRHLRPKFACTRCHTVTQALAPSRPIERCMAGAGLIAHVMVSKYADHCPLYRQSQICAREDVVIAASTMGGWMGSGAALLTPLAQAIGRYALQAYKVHSDDTPTRALGAGKGKAHLGRIWAYVRDDRGWGDSAHPAVWFQYSEDRRGEHPRQHLGKFSGVLQVDAFAGYNAIFNDGSVLEAACWAHARRKYFEIHKQQDLLPGTLAHQALQRIARIYAVESEVRGHSAELRRSQRQLRTRPVLEEMHVWLHAALGQGGGSRNGARRRDESRVSLIKAMAGSNSFTWVYDYGDYWEHKIKFERIVDLGVPLDTAMCITGRNACPPEDVGGTPGYAEFLDAIRDSANPDHQTMLQWCGGAFDPSAFDPFDAQLRLDQIKL